MDLNGIHVWRQTQTQTVINNFCNEDFNILHPKRNSSAHTDRLLLMEFPIMQWIFAIPCKLLSNNVVISRILSFIIGLFTVWGMYRLTSILMHNKVAATICAWCFNFSPVFYYYTVNPLPDNFALCFAVWSLYFSILTTQNNKLQYFILASAMACIATLAKLPFIIYTASIISFQILQLLINKSIKIFSLRVLLFMLIMTPAISWYMYVIPTWPKHGVLTGMFNNNKETSMFFNILWGNIVSTLPELLINYASVPFFIAGFIFAYKNRIHKHPNFNQLLFCLILVVVYFLYELNMIDTVHDYYLFPFLPFIFLVVSYGAINMLKQYKLHFIAIIALLILPLTAYLRINTRWNETSPGFNAVYYQEKDKLQKLIPNDALCVVGNDESGFILLYYLDKKGWTFNRDLTKEKLAFYIANGADYLFTDNNDNVAADFIEKKIYKQGSLSVYKLKSGN